MNRTDTFKFLRMFVKLHVTELELAACIEECNTFSYTQTYKDGTKYEIVVKIKSDCNVMQFDGEYYTYFDDGSVYELEIDNGRIFLSDEYCEEYRMEDIEDDYSEFEEDYVDDDGVI
jgi:hypothetical protein